MPYPYIEPVGPPTPAPMTTATQSSAPGVNVDQAEVEKFSALAARWWDPESEFKPLHAINPLRLGWIQETAGSLSGKRVLDVGCGGGQVGGRIGQGAVEIEQDEGAHLRVDIR